jgi:transcriptional regulator with XRE-family HTH domain
MRRRLAANVRRHREARRFTLEEAADRAEMHWRHWQKVEAGEVNATLRTLARLADALGVDPAELMTDDGRR